jgi:ATP-dependent DNA ligase
LPTCQPVSRLSAPLPQPSARPRATIDFRFQVIKDGSDVRLYSKSRKSGAVYSNKLPSMRKAFAELPTNSAILDGELCLIDRRGGAHFYRLMHHMRTRWPEESLLVFLAFDLLHQDGWILRSSALSERKRDLNRQCLLDAPAQQPAVPVIGFLGVGSQDGTQTLPRGAPSRFA